MEKETFDKAAAINAQLQKVNNTLGKIEMTEKSEHQNIVLAFDGGSYCSSSLGLTENAQKVLDAAVVEIKTILLKEKAVLEKQFKAL